MKRIYYLILSLATLLITTGSAAADLTIVEESNDRGTEVVYQLTVTPAAEPVPAMKYRFTVPDYQTIPANAITHYLRSFGEGGFDRPLEAARKKWGKDFFLWYGQRLSMKELPMDKVKEFCGNYDSYVENHIARATRCRYADWGLGEEDLTGMEAIEFLLPSIQQTRSISRVLALRTRLAVAEGRTDDAIEHIRMNYQLAQNVGKLKFLVAGLVGVAEIGITNETVLELIASPDSPNLYWALAELPDPIVDQRDSLRLEMSFGPRLIPELQNVETAEHTKEEWARILSHVVSKTTQVGQVVSGNSRSEKGGMENLYSAGIGLASFSGAKKRLIDQGFNKDEVNKMAVGQVLLIDMAREYRRIADMYEKAIYVSFAESKKLIEVADEELRSTESKIQLGTLLAGQLLPAISQVRQAQVRVQWQVRSLQVVEAIRMHIDATGKLPLTLDEINVVPIPVNPFSGNPFDYECDGTTAILRLGFNDSATYAQRYEITIAK